MDPEVATTASSAEPLLRQDEPVPGVVNFKGQPVRRSSSGGWRAASFIIGVEVAESLAFYGISLNLISYLTGPMAQSTAEAAVNINLWNGVASMLPLLGAFVADSYLGRYRTIFYSSFLYTMGLGLLALSASLPSHLSAVFFVALYLVALGQGGHKPCTQALGADQFDPMDPTESKAMSSFFNWWYMGINAGVMFSLSTVVYVQDFLSWGLGFGIPCAVMASSLLLFLLGTATYRHTPIQGTASPFLKMSKPIHNCFNGEGKDGDNKDESKSQYSSLLSLIPIWVTCLVYGIIFPQVATLFTKQASTLNRIIGSSFLISPASLQIIVCFTLVIAIPIYERIFVPLARSFTGIPPGVTTLKRIGMGMAVSIAEMLTAAAVEARRLDVAREAGLLDEPGQMVPMSAWWMVPQYILQGVSNLLTVVGLQEFFYSEMPDGLKSLGSALYLSIFCLGASLVGY